MEKEPQNQQEQFNSMTCGHSEKSVSELEAEGWEEVYSFHSNIVEQWNIACEKVDELKKFEDYEVVLINGKTESEKKDGVSYIYRRRTQQRKDYDEQKGYKY